MITLLIPTMNRSEFLIRQLNYYKSVGFTGHICIGDSSDTAHLERMKEAIGELQNSLTITYKEYPRKNDAEVLKRLLDFVVTPYAAFVADDDFFVPSALEKCVSFLEGHRDYNSVHGTSLTIYLKEAGAYGQVTGANHYPLPVIEGESAAERILGHLNNYAVTLFGVHRIGSWREMYRDISRLADKTFAAELLPCCLSVIQGKAKELDCLYLVRQDHPQRYLLPDKHKWISNPNWLSLYEVFLELLSKALAEKDRIDTEKAREVVEQAFGAYMTNLLGSEWRSYCGKNQKDIFERLRRIIQKTPGARTVWRALASFRAGPQVEITPAELISASSPYQSEMIPLIKALSENNFVFSGKTK